MTNLTKPAWLYLTTNNINGKKYIGQTTSTRPYLGSGILILAAIKKYGKENFTREILYSGTWEEVDLLESMYIEKYDAVLSENFYNLKDGGHDGSHGMDTIKKMSVARKGKSYQEIYGEEEGKRQIELKRVMNTGEGNPFFGKSHSDETVTIIKDKRALQVITEESNKKRSDTNALLPKFECVHCGGLFFKRNLIQHHGDKCKKVKK